MRWWLMQHMYAMCWKDWNVNDLKCFLARFFSSCKKNGRRWWCVHHEVCIIDWGHHPLLTPRTSSCWISSTASSWAMTSINKSMLQLMLHVQWLHLLHTQTSLGQMFKLVLGNFLTSPLSHSHQDGAKQHRNSQSVQQQILDPTQLLPFQTRNVKWVQDFFLFL